MKDRTYEILKAKYAPHLVDDVSAEVTEVQVQPVSLEYFVLQVRKSYLEGCGLNPLDRHEWADKIVSGLAVLRLEQASGVKMG
ncbi:hypothetical protein [Pseudomonas sp. MN1F]|uniref:hypothetical protein n=1 Tax=Pseudomonas sp. MN1F TaxID=1366632 RepID=UPI00128EF07C|nr:hypothetical protein [Pseudomonas sp. MN1F]MQG91332.1 hypothetical protein [Pseudomonas sp. MN1F]